MSRAFKSWCIIASTLILVSIPFQDAYAASGKTLLTSITRQAIQKLQDDGVANNPSLAWLNEFLQNQTGNNSGSSSGNTIKQLNSRYKIVLDPGHGGSDPGTMMAKEKESSITLDISRKIQSLLNDSGYQTVMTRSTDVSLTKLSGIAGTAVQKDLNARTNIFNNSQSDLFVSIHVNSLPSRPEVSGSVVYYNSKSPASKALAQAIQKELNSFTVNGQKRSQHGIQTANFYVLRNSNIPGVLVETAFATNKQERELLSTQDFRNRIANAVVKGIDAYLK